jgi:[phosphatase 2A protein]-leucine-carboxy methyltransferase
VDSGTILSPTYCLHAKDIRSLPLDTELPPYLDPELPTIFISECCLVYMDIEDATAVLRWITRTFRKNGVGLILYEPIGGNDAFGKMMIKNLAVKFPILTELIYQTRGINLKTLAAYPTLQHQTLRLKDCGFASGQDAININFSHDNWMGQSELRRISRLELLDEMEEWRLLASHYCIVWGWNDANAQGDSKNGAFKEWGDIKNTRA